MEPPPPPHPTLNRARRLEKIVSKMFEEMVK
jgi:hypothetical protein